MTKKIANRIMIEMDIDEDVFKYYYVPLKESFSGTWVEFNSFMMHLAMLTSSPVLDHAYDLMKKKGKLKGTEEEVSEIKRKAMLKFFMDFMDKADKMNAGKTIDSVIKNLNKGKE